MHPRVKDAQRHAHTRKHIVAERDIVHNHNVKHMMCNWQRKRRCWAHIASLAEMLTRCARAQAYQVSTSSSESDMVKGPGKHGYQDAHDQNEGRWVHTRRMTRNTACTTTQTTLNERPQKAIFFVLSVCRPLPPEWKRSGFCCTAKWQQKENDTRLKFHKFIQVETDSWSSGSDSHPYL